MEKLINYKGCPVHGILPSNNRYDRDSHGGEHQQYTTRILSKDRSVLPLSILEALYIEKQIPGTSLNERNEFGRGSIVRLSAERAVS